MDLVGGDKINKAKLADGWEEKDGEGKEEVGKKEKSRDKRKRLIGFISYIFQHDRSARHPPKHLFPKRHQIILILILILSLLDYYYYHTVCGILQNLLWFMLYTECRKQHALRLNLLPGVNRNQRKNHHGNI